MSMIDGGALSSGRSSVPTIERASRVNAIRIGPDWCRMCVLSMVCSCAWKREVAARRSLGSRRSVRVPDVTRFGKRVCEV